MSIFFIILLFRIVSSQCTSKYYQSGNYICQKCHEQCNECFGSTNFECNSCQIYEENGKCVSDCSSNNPLIQNSLCTPNTIRFCKVQKNLNQCQECDKGFILSNQNQECIKQQKLSYTFIHENTNEVISIQDYCPDGYKANTHNHCEHQKTCDDDRENIYGQSYLCFYQEDASLLILENMKLVYQHQYGTEISITIIDEKKIIIVSILNIIQLQLNSSKMTILSLSYFQSNQSKDNFLKHFLYQEDQQYFIIYCKNYQIGIFDIQKKSFIYSNYKSEIYSCLFIEDKISLLVSSESLVIYSFIRIQDISNNLDDSIAYKSNNFTSHFDLLGYNNHLIYLTSNDDTFRGIYIIDFMLKNKIFLKNEEGAQKQFSYITNSNQNKELILLTTDNVFIISSNNEMKNIFNKCGKKNSFSSLEFSQLYGNIYLDDLQLIYLIGVNFDNKLIIISYLLIELEYQSFNVFSSNQILDIIYTSQIETIHLIDEQVLIIIEFNHFSLEMQNLQSVIRIQYEQMRIIDIEYFTYVQKINDQILICQEGKNIEKFIYFLDQKGMLILIPDIIYSDNLVIKTMKNNILIEVNNVGIYLYTVHDSKNIQKQQIELYSKYYDFYNNNLIVVISQENLCFYSIQTSQIFKQIDIFNKNNIITELQVKQQTIVLVSKIIEEKKSIIYDFYDIQGYFGYLFPKQGKEYVNDVYKVEFYTYDTFCILDIKSNMLIVSIFSYNPYIIIINNNDQIRTRYNFQQYQIQDRNLKLLKFYERVSINKIDKLSYIEELKLFNLQYGEFMSSQSLISIFKMPLKYFVNDQKVNSRFILYQKHIIPNIATVSIIDEDFNINDFFTSSLIYYPKSGLIMLKLYNDDFEILRLQEIGSNKVIFNFKTRNYFSIKLFIEQNNILIVSSSTTIYIYNLDNLQNPMYSKYHPSLFCNENNFCEILVSKYEQIIYVNQLGIYYYNQDILLENNLTFIHGSNPTEYTERQEGLYVWETYFVTIRTLTLFTRPDFNAQIFQIANLFKLIFRNIFQDKYIVFQARTLDIYEYKTLYILKSFQIYEDEGKNSYDQCFFECLPQNNIFILYNEKIVGYSIPLNPNSDPTLIFKIDSNYKYITCTETHVIIKQQVDNYTNRFVLLSIVTLKPDSYLPIKEFEIELLIPIIQFVPQKQMLIYDSSGYFLNGEQMIIHFSGSKFIYDPYRDIAITEDVENIKQDLDFKIYDMSQFNTLDEKKYSFDNRQTPYLQNEQLVVYYDEEANSFVFYDQQTDKTKLISLKESNYFTDRQYNRIKIYSFNDKNYSSKEQNLYVAVISEKGLILFTTKNILVSYQYDKDIDYFIENTFQEYQVIIGVYEQQLFQFKIKFDKGQYSVIKSELNIIKRQLNEHTLIVADCQSINENSCRNMILYDKRYYRQYNDNISFIETFKTNKEYLIVGYLNNFKIVDVLSYQNIFFEQEIIQDKIRQIMFDQIWNQLYIIDSLNIKIYIYNEYLNTFSFIANLPMHTRSTFKLKKVDQTKIAVISMNVIQIHSIKPKNYGIVQQISYLEFLKVSDFYQINNQYNFEYYVAVDIENIFIFQRLTVDKLNMIKKISQNFPIIFSIKNYRENLEDVLHLKGFEKYKLFNKKIFVNIISKNKSISDNCKASLLLEPVKGFQRNQLQSYLEFNIKVNDITLQVNSTDQDILIPYFKIERKIRLTYDLQGNKVQIFTTKDYEPNSIENITFANGEIISKENSPQIIPEFYNYQQIIFQNISLNQNLLFINCKIFSLKKVNLSQYFSNLSIKNNDLPYSSITLSQINVQLFHDNSQILNVVKTNDLMMQNINVFQSINPQVTKEQKLMVNQNILFNFTDVEDLKILNFQITNVQITNMIYLILGSTRLLFNNLNFKNIQYINDQNKYSQPFIQVLYTKDKIELRNLNIEDSQIPQFLNFNDTMRFRSNSVTSKQYDKYTNINLSKNLNLLLKNIQIKNISIILQQGSGSQNQDYFFDIQTNITKLYNITINNISNVNLFKLTSKYRIEIINLNSHSLNNLNNAFMIYDTPKIILKDIQIYQYNEVDIVFQIINCNISIFQMQINPQYEQKNKDISYQSKNSSIIIKSDNIQSKTQIYNSSFKNIICYQCDGSVLYINKISQVYLEQVQIQYCKSSGNGGGILAFKSRIILNFVILRSNIADLSGGAIFLDQSTIQVIDLTSSNHFQKTIITENQALIGGGVRYNAQKQFIQEIVQILQKVTVQNKCTFYSQNYGMILKKISIFDTSKMNILRSVQSSFSQTQQVNIGYLDEEDNYANFPKEELNRLNNDEKYIDIFTEIQSYRNIQIISKNIVFNNLYQKSIKVQGQFSEQNEVIQLNFNMVLKPEASDFINFLKQTQINELDQIFTISSEYIKVEFIQCQKGEILKNTYQNLYECIECSQKSYSLADPTTLNLKCKNCPITAQQCSKNQLIPKDGYWLEHGSDNIFECTNQPLNCIISNLNKSQSDENDFTNCIEGSIGPKCESCDYMSSQWPEGPYGRGKNWSCVKCSQSQEMNNQIARLIILLLMTAFYFSYLTLAICKRGIILIQCIYLKKAGIVHFGSSLNPNSIGLIFKRMTSYLQQATLLYQFQFSLNLEFNSIINLSSNPVSSTVYSLDCQLIYFGWTKHQPIVYIRLIWILAQNLVYALSTIIIITILTFFQYNKINRIYRNVMIKRNFFTSLTYLYFVLNPGLIQSLSEIIFCEHIGQKKLIIADNQYECYTKLHYLYSYGVCIPLLILLIIIIPLVIIYKLKKYKNKFMTLGVYLQYNFFFFEYKDQFYYWELIKIVYISIIHLGLNFFNGNIVAKGAFLCIIMICKIRVQYQFQPYKKSRMNTQEYLETFVLILCFQIGIFNYQTDSLQVKTLCLILVSLLNLIIVLFLVVKQVQQKVVYNELNCYYKVIKVLQKISPKLINFIFMYRQSSYNSHKNWKKVRTKLHLIRFRSSNNIIKATI